MPRVKWLGAAAVKGNAQIWNMDRFGWSPCLVEDVDGDAAARVPEAGDAEPFGFGFRDEAFGDRHSAVFMKGSVIAERREIELERFAFDEGGFGDVIDDEKGEIRLARDRAERSEFRAREADDVIRAAVRVFDCFDDGFAGRSGYFGFVAEELERGWFWHGLVPDI